MTAPPPFQEYRIASEPRGPALEALLSYSAAVGSYCSLTDQFPRNKKGQEARERFLNCAKPNLLGIDDVNTWPGTIVNGTVPLWRFRMGADLIDLLCTQSKGLFDFQASKLLPEDFAAYRSDGSVLLGSVAHEHMGWMNLTADERADRRLGLVELRPKRR